VSLAASGQISIHRRVLTPMLAAAVLAILTVLLDAGLILMGIPAHQNELADYSLGFATGLPLAAVGFVIARRQPRNTVGWLLLAAAAGTPLTSIGGTYALLIYHLGYRLPLGPAALLLGYSWIVPTASPALAILLFPDGRLPSLRWRWALATFIVAVACFLGATYAAAGNALTDRNVRFDSSGGITAIDYPSGWLAVVDEVTTAAIAACLVSFVFAQVLNWRRSDADRRQQLKWLLSGGVAFLACGIVELSVSVVDHRPSALVQASTNALDILGYVALMVGMGVAILRYRLYDIDRIISRTLSYTVITAVLAGLYAGLVLLATEVLDLTSQVAVAVATLAAAAVFNPVRRRVQRLVDRRFNRARYDADNTVAAFAARLQDAADPDAVRSDLIGTVHQVIEPAHISVWMPGGRP
jgi:hypothetical protein